MQTPSAMNNSMPLVEPKNKFKKIFIYNAPKDTSINGKRIQN